MKLLSCYVENYGAISQRTYHFNDGITAFCEENGAGKTTLASFIKAMFYGLDSYRSNTREFCDRQHFYPFTGGNFGGNLTFEWEGHTYRIERFFGEKSDTADSLAVYCDGTRTERFGDDIGREIFGIDRQSFERTLFVDSAEIECATTADIGARLNRFLEGVGEDVDYDGARAILDKAASALKKTRGSGEITIEKERVQQLDLMIRNAERTGAGLAAKYEAYDALCTEIQALDAAVERARAENELLAKWGQYEYICAEAKAAKEKRDELLARYPAGIPAEEEVRACAAALGKKRESMLVASTAVLSEQEAAALSSLCLMFGAGVPDEETLDEREQIAQRIVTLDAQIATLETAEPRDGERGAMTRLGGKKPSADEVAAVKEKTDTYRAARAACENAPATLGAMPSVPKKNAAGRYLAVAIVAAIVTLLGVALLFVNPVLGGVVAALGGISLLVDAFLYLNGRTGAAMLQTERENPEKLRLASVMREAEYAAVAALSSYGYSAEEGVEIACYQFCEDVAAYAAYEKRDAERRAALAFAVDEKMRLTVALDAFLSRYALSGEGYGTLLARLRADRTQYLALREKEKAIAKKQAELADEQRALDGQISAFAEKYGEEALNTEQTLADLTACQSLALAASEGEKRAEAYRTERGLSEKPTPVTLDVEASVTRLATLRDEKIRALRDIEQDERDVDALEVYRNEREQARERMAALEVRYHLLRAAMTKLDEADNALKERYVSPVKNCFTQYADLIEKTIGERVMMSGDFEVTFDVNGKQRSEKHLSAGQRSICALCFRLALVENMYGGEIPFLVMDDPFLTMDENHLSRVRGLMQELAKRTQILYFTCHESRNM